VTPLDFGVPSSNNELQIPNFFSVLGLIFMIFDPPSSNDIDPQLYITKLLITKSSRSFVGECYNEPVRRASEHSRKLVSSSVEKRGCCERRQL